jgi:hypothetical protein
MPIPNRQYRVVSSNVSLPSAVVAKPMQECEHRFQFDTVKSTLVGRLNLILSGIFHSEERGVILELS